MRAAASQDRHSFGCGSHTLFSLEGGQAAATRILRLGVTGIICGSDVLALGAIRAVRRAGLRVPGDVSVVGYDGSWLLNCTDPPDSPPSGSRSSRWARPRSPCW